MLVAGCAMLLALAPSSEAPGATRWRLRASVLAGADSNLRQNARSAGWSAAAVTRAEGTTHVFLGDDVAGLSGHAIFDVGEGADRAHRLTVGVGGLWSRFVVGRGRAYGFGRRSRTPSLRMDLRGRYRGGLRLDARAFDREASELDDDDLGAEPSSMVFLAPFHDLGAGIRLLYRPRRATEISLRGRLRRSWRSRDPGEPSPHFTELSGRLSWRKRWRRSVSLRLQYELGARSFDARTNEAGDRRVDIVHRPRFEVRFPGRRLGSRFGYGIRVLDADRDGRDRLRHEGWGEARWALDALWDLLVRVDFATESRAGRPDRDWNRIRGMAGVAVAL